MGLKIKESPWRRKPAALLVGAVAASALAVAGCGGGGSGSGASPGVVASYVPAGSPVYLEATTDFNGPQWTQVDKLAKLFPAYPKLRADLERSLESGNVNFDTEVRPLLGGRAAIGVLSIPRSSSIQAGASRGKGASTAPAAAVAAAASDTQAVGVVEIAKGKQDAMKALLVKSGAAAAGTYDGAALYTSKDRSSVAAVTSDALVVSDTKARVEKSLDAHKAGGDKTLGGTARFADAIGKLPADVFGQAYLDLGGIVDRAGQSSAQLQQLGLGDYRNATLAASIAAEPDGVRVKGVVSGAPDAGQSAFSPSLDAKAPADAIAYLGFDNLSAGVQRIVQQVRASQSEDARKQLDSLETQLPALLGVPLADLSALASGEQAVVVTPSTGAKEPGAVLAMQVADGARATSTLDRLRANLPRIVQMLGDKKPLPAWQKVPLAGGVTGWRLPLSPKADAVYGVDGKLALVGTSARAVTAVQRPTAPLSDSAAFKAATSGMPDQVTSLAWINIQQVVDSARRLGGPLLCSPSSSSAEGVRRQWQSTCSPRSRSPRATRTSCATPSPMPSWTTSSPTTRTRAARSRSPRRQAWSWSWAR